MISRDAILAFEIRLTAREGSGERTVFHLLAHRDGTLQRQGTARLRDPAGPLQVGRINAPLQPLIDALPDAVLTQPGSYAIPGGGTPLALRISLWTVDASQAIELAYGADGDGPPRSIVDFVLQARAWSDAWYRAGR